MAAQAAPQAVQWADGREHTHAAQAQPHGEAGHAGCGGAHVGALQRAVQRLRLRAKSLEAPGLGRACEARHGVERMRRVGMQIERCAVFPPVARQHRQLANAQLGFEAGAHRSQQFVEHPAQREHGGAAVDGRAVHHQLAQLAARAFSGFHHRHVQALVGQSQGAHQPADAGTHHDHLVFRHGLAARCGHLAAAGLPPPLGGPSARASGRGV